MHNEKQVKVKKTWLRTTGIVLIILSCLFYGALLVVPFTPFSLATKAVMSTTLIVLGEASFWIGGIILGREFIIKFRKYLNPFKWFKKSKQ